MSDDLYVKNGIRLQKVLAEAGYGSRRAVENLILEARVEVNGKIITELGMRVDPQKQEIRVDYELVNIPKSHKTVALYKPVGVVSTMSDPQGRPTLADLTDAKYGRLFHIGRLDTDSEGLILMTNDGDLAQKIAHPHGNVDKKYVVTLNGKITQNILNTLIKGIELKDGFSQFDKARILGTDPNTSLVEVVIHSGKNRIVRRMFKEVGFKVTSLIRTQIGPIKLGQLKPGRSRVLSDIEVKAFEKLAHIK